MVISSPKARFTEASGLAALATLDFLDVELRARSLDQIRSELSPYIHDGDAAARLGVSLVNEAEVRALNGVRAAFFALYDLRGGRASSEEMLNHPYFPAVICTAAYASDLMQQNGVPPFDHDPNVPWSPVASGAPQPRNEPRETNPSRNISIFCPRARYNQARALEALAILDFEEHDSQSMTLEDIRTDIFKYIDIGDASQQHGRSLVNKAEVSGQRRPRGL